jgi:zinc transporter, ZIP family
MNPGDALLSVLPFILLAAAAGLLGGGLAVFWNPHVQMRSAIQHFAAGVVLAAVASDLIPEVERIGTPFGIVAGLVAGGAAMIALKWFILRLERREKGKKLPFGLASAAAVDTLLDGAIIGAGFILGQGLGIILAIALALELFFLTLSVGSEFGHGKRTRWQGFLITSGISALLLVGAIVSTLVLADASETTIAIVLAFGAAALVYLIAEELLVENIQAEESLFSTATLFAGFVVIIAFELLSSS